MASKFFTEAEAKKRDKAAADFISKSIEWVFTDFDSKYPYYLLVAGIITGLCGLFPIGIPLVIASIILMNRQADEESRKENTDRIVSAMKKEETTNDNTNNPAAS